MVFRLEPSRKANVDVIATAKLAIETRGRGLVEITRELQRFLRDAGAKDGVLLIFLRHTSASLLIQENADPDVRSDLLTALDRVAPENAGWIHDSEGADDMPSHVKTMLTGVSLHVPVVSSTLGLGAWQGVFLAEHRSGPHTREMVLQFFGSSHR
jgi:secondary thiamine-phosphate synthase enzyme